MQRGHVVSGQGLAQHHRAPVGRVALEQVVVDLRDDQRALGQRGAEAPAVAPLSPAGRPGTHPGCVVESGVAFVDARVAEAGPAVARGLGVLLPGLVDLVRRHPEEDHVVHHVEVVRPDVVAGDRGVMRELRVEQEAVVVVAARRRWVPRACTASRAGAPDASRPCAAGSAWRASAWSAPRRPRRPSYRTRRVTRHGALASGADSLPHPVSTSASAATAAATRGRLIPAASPSTGRRARAGGRGTPSGSLPVPC